MRLSARKSSFIAAAGLWTVLRGSVDTRQVRRKAQGLQTQQGCDALLKDVDFSKNGTSPSLSDPGMGYVLRQNYDPRAYEFANSLQVRFGIEHDLAGPPRLCEVFDGNRTDELFLQPVRIPGNDSILLNSKIHETIPKLRSLIQGRGSQAHPVEAVVSMQRHIQAAERAFQAHPCLSRDFQVLLRLDGTLTHVGLERCFAEQGQVHKPDLEHLLRLFENLACQEESETGHWTRKAVLKEEDDDTSVILDGTELMSQLDTDGLVSCGYIKCAYRNATDPSLGVLAGIDFKPPTNDYFADLLREPGANPASVAYDFAVSLERRFGIRHSLASPPRRYRFSASDAEALENTPERCGTFPYCFREPFVGHVQPVNFFDAERTTLIKTRKDVEGVAAIEHPEVLRENIARHRRMLAEEPCMWVDHQFLLHQDGTIMQIDFDRCFKYRGQKPLPIHTEALDWLEKMVAEALGEGSDTQ